MIPINRPEIIGNILRYDLHALEEKFRNYYPNRHIYLTFSCRQALYEVYKHLKANSNKNEVITSPLTCFEALYPILANDLKLKFVDVNEETFNMDENKIIKSINKNTLAIQVIHLGGNPQDLDSIKDREGITLIEDCAQSFGSIYKDRPVGLDGDYSCFSLMKNLYALAGGLLLSKNPLNISKEKTLGYIATGYRLIKRKLDSKRSLNSNLINLLYGLFIRLKPKRQDNLFSDVKINNQIIKSIGNQLSEFDEMVKRRIKNANYIRSSINNKSLKLQKIDKNAKSCFTRIYIQTNKNKSIEIIKILKEKGIEAKHLGQNFLLNYQKSVFREIAFMKFAKENELINYKRLHDRIFCLPISSNMTQNELEYIVKNINDLN